MSILLTVLFSFILNRDSHSLPTINLHYFDQIEVHSLECYIYKKNQTFGPLHIRHQVSFELHFVLYIHSEERKLKS